MSLSCMIYVGRDELICDFAETYHIYNMKSLPPQTAAVLACGLRNDSRIKMKLAGLNYSLSELLTAMIYDRLAWLCWAQTPDAKDGINRPAPMLDILMGKAPEKDDIAAFDSPEEFELARKAALKGVF